MCQRAKFTFHDPWHPKHMTDPKVTKVYSPEGIKAVEKNKIRVRVGKDALLMDVLKRLFPVGLQKQLRRVA